MDKISVLLVANAIFFFSFIHIDWLGKNYTCIIKQAKSQSIQSLGLESYRTGLGLLWASLNQPKQKKNILKIKDFMKVFKWNLFFYPGKKIAFFHLNVFKKVLLVKGSVRHFIIRASHGSPQSRVWIYAIVHSAAPEFRNGHETGSILLTLFDCS